MNILSITGPIYLVIVGGFLSVRLGLFEKRDTRALGTFVANFCVPALLFRTLGSRDIDEVLDLRYMLAYACGSLTVLLGTYFGMRRLRGAVSAKAALLGLGMSSSNSAYIGFPIASQLLGPAAAAGLALVMLVENVLMVPLALALAEGSEGGRRSWRDALAPLRRLARNPMILAIVAGFSVALLDLEVPDVLARTVQLVAAAASPTSLFVIGGTLVGLRLRGVRREVALITFGKLVLHPLAVLLFLELLRPSDASLRTAAVIYAMVPMLSIYPILAQKYHLEELAAAALLVTTVAAFGSISLWLWVLHALLGWK
jgi:predicted permease